MLHKINIYRFAASIFIIAVFVLGLNSCNDESINSKSNSSMVSNKSNQLMSAENSVYSQINLVSNVPGFNALRTDGNLVNAWGITINPGAGIFWLSSNGANSSVVYDTIGNQKRTPVTIPTPTSSTGGAPTGVVFNSTISDFVIPSTGVKSKFIFAQEDGIISAWSSGNGAIKVADRSGTGAVYKGIAMGTINGSNYLFAANFHGRSVDVFDKDFNYVSNITFNDSNIPSDFGPFNIANIDDNLYVTYAKFKAPDNHDDQAGQGNGYVDVYQTNGQFIKRFATRGQLNSPWGIVKVASGFGQDDDNILIGNFGDGKINVFNSYGNFRSRLKDANKREISIDGLWGLFFIPSNSPGNKTWLYFTAGPAGESEGLFGYLKLISE